VADQPHAKVRQLIAYWRGQAPGPDLLPGRQHFDPMHLTLFHWNDGTVR
jgi:hypothetical protein